MRPKYVLDLQTVEGLCRNCGRAPFRHGECVLCHEASSRTCPTSGCNAVLQPNERCYQCSSCLIHGRHRTGESCPTWAALAKVKDIGFGVVAAILAGIILVLFFGFYIVMAFEGYGVFKAFETLVAQWMWDAGARTEAIIWFFWMIAAAAVGAGLFLLVVWVSGAFGKLAKEKSVAHK